MKKIGILLIMAVMALTLLSANGAEEGSVSSDRIMPNMTGTRVVDETVQMTAVVNISEYQTDPEELEFMQFIQEETGVDWLFDAIPGSGGEYDQKLNLMFAAGDLPDVVYSGGTQSFIVEQSSIGTIVPLDDLIDNYTVNIKEALTRRDDFKRALTTPDGNIYSLWAVEEAVHRNWVDPLFVNERWLANVGMDAPTTTEEFKEVLMAFKEQDANGNGDPNDEIPFTCREGGWSGQRLDGFFGAWGVFDGGNRNHILWEKGKVSLSATDPRYREGLEYLNELYELGLIDPEIFTQNVAQLKAKGKGDLIGSLIFYWPTNVFGADKVKEYQFIPLLSGPRGDKNAYQDNPIGGWLGFKYLITTENPMPEVAIRYADVLLDGKDMSISAAFGPEGKFWEKKGDQWTRNGDKIPEGLGEVQYRDSMTLKNQISNRDRKAYENFIPDDMTETRSGWFYQIEEFMTPPRPLLWFQPDISSELDLLNSELHDYAHEMRARFIIEGITDESWDAYVKNMDKIGAPRFLEIYQEAYTNYYK